MNRLRFFLVLFLLLSSLVSSSQQGFLFVKKGYKKKRTYTEGDMIQLRLEDGSYRKGTITLLRNDTIFIDGNPVYRPQVVKVILEKKPVKLPDVKTLLLIGAGSALTAAGLAVAQKVPPGKAIFTGLVIGYGPLLVKLFGNCVVWVVKRKKFRINKKFRLQVLDFHIPQRAPKPF
ncbi:MAG TPA: hypothetical protein VFI06_03245 [Chitinophagaceae bacterium]|nr:hypothetical protein [Chitinophagaceae bacterium]